jgi:hypothetical protein
MFLYEFQEKFPSVKTHTAEELADKHSVPVGVVERELDRGAKIEMEHTTDYDVAKEIAADHIAEFLDYYDRLEQVEEQVDPEGRIIVTYDVHWDDTPQTKKLRDHGQSDEEAIRAVQKWFGGRGHRVKRTT